MIIATQPKLYQDWSDAVVAEGLVTTYRHAADTALTSRISWLSVAFTRETTGGGRGGGA